MLDIDAVHTYYGESHILHGVSLALAAGEAVAILGRNGAGKTTLIRTIVGFTPPRRGTVTFGGRAIHRQTPYRIARLGIGLVPQGRRIFAPLTVTENLLLGAGRGGGPGRVGGAGRPGGADGRDAGVFSRERIYALFPRLRERGAQSGGTLSGGEQQMLAIGRALMTNPKLLLLDEPSEGLAPRVVGEIGRVLVGLKGEGLSILLVEQNVPLALRVADRVYVMNKGQIVYHGSPAELDANEDVKHRYLGVS
ncbi:MAG TPA: ABC transporter ATP-binding protein [Methylomirabilota bacterium]|jgi:branched-chain amino acid transport system ATP-binding protein